MSVWVGVWLSCAKWTGGTGTSSLDKRYMTQWEHSTLLHTLQRLAPSPDSPGNLSKTKRGAVCVCLFVCLWPNAAPCAYVYMCVYILYSCVCACVRIWILLREISRLYPWCFLPLPEHSHSHWATLWLIAKYTGCCFRCWQQTLLKFWLIGTQYPIKPLSGLMLSKPSKTGADSSLTSSENHTNISLFAT